MTHLTRLPSSPSTTLQLFLMKYSILVGLVYLDIVRQSKSPNPQFPRNLYLNNLLESKGLEGGVKCWFLLSNIKI